MSNIGVLHKILTIREQEKKRAQIASNRAVDNFEKTAKQLYLELKAKEAAEETLKKFMESSTSITNIKDQSLFIDSLNKKIMTLQLQVQKLRTEMEAKQGELTEAHIEFKKIEKMIELREEEKHQMEKQLQMKLMDDLSIRQFISQSQIR